MKVEISKEWLLEKLKNDPDLPCEAGLPLEGERKMSIVCKMNLENVFGQTWGGSKAIFRCIYDSKIAEDVSFQKATPSGFAEFQIDNPKAAEQLVIGEQYYVTFERVSKPIS